MILESGEEQTITWIAPIIDLETNVKERIEKFLASETRKHVCTNVVLVY